MYDKLYNWGAPILLQPDAIFRTDSWWVNWPGGNPILLPCGVSPGLRPSVFSPAELYACSASHQARIPLAASIASSHLYCYAAQLQSVQPLLAWRHSYLLFKAITWRPSPAPVRGHQLFVVIWMKFTQILCRSTTVYSSVFLHSTTIILFCLVLGPFPVLAQVLSPLRLLQSWPTHFQD